MIAQRKRRELPCVLLDISTQNDFLLANGTCPVRNHKELLPKLRKVVAWAKRNQVPVISTVDSHRQQEFNREKLPPHCIDGTHGQRKIDFTIFGSYVKVEGDNTLAVPVDLFSRHQQVIFRKRSNDLFANPKADRFVCHLPAAEYIVVGTGLENALRAAALGLLTRNKSVSIITDACGFWDGQEADLTVRVLQAKGVGLLTVEELTARRLPRPIRYPLCSFGQISLRNGLYASITPPAYPAHGVNGHARTNGHPRTNGAMKRNGVIRPNGVADQSIDEERNGASQSIHKKP